MRCRWACLTPAGVAAGLLGGRRAISTNLALGRLIGAHAGFTSMSDARVPLHVMATDLLTGKPVVLSTRSVVAAVQASAAIPGIHPPVLTGGKYLVDGAVSQHCGVTHAVEAGASLVYVLPTGYACALAHPPRTALGVALHALTLLMEQRLIAEVAACAGRATIRVLPPLCPLRISAADFSHAAELIGRARAGTARWLTSGALDGPHPERFLTLHGHSPSSLPEPSATATHASF